MSASRSFAKGFVTSGILFVVSTLFATPLPNAWLITDYSGTSAFYYSTNLPETQRLAATNISGGFRLTVVGRYSNNFTIYYTMGMSYGLGNNRGFRIWWRRDNNNNLTAQLEGGSTYVLTTNGLGASHYHTHEIVYNPTNGTASYLFDGQVKTNSWSPPLNFLPAGRVAWGALDGQGNGQMNFNRATFEITNTVMAEYDAGTEGNPMVAPDPIAESWFLNSGSGPTATNISPDTALLPVPLTLAASQLTNSTAQLNGQANPSGSPTVGWFEWGTDTTFGNVTPAQSLGQGVSLSNLNSIISGLSIGPNYLFRVVASNTFGTVTGPTRVFSFSFLHTPVAGLFGVSAGSAVWADYDNDGRVDFLLTGDMGTGARQVSQLWRNVGTGFSNVTASLAPGLPRVRDGFVAWNDYDNDGRLDFLITGTTNFSSDGAISQLWRNTGSGFSNVTANVAPGLPRAYQSSVAWGDYDNDGRSDFLLSGTVGFTTTSQLWKNTGSGFSNVTAQVVPGLQGISNGSMAWGDYDNDGRLDFLIAGLGFTDFAVTQIWRNSGKSFSNVTAQVAPGLPLAVQGSTTWVDYDSDGRLDFMHTGFLESGSRVAQLWRNTGNIFTNVTGHIAIGLPGVFNSSIAWGDYDNDGRADFLLTGRTNTGTQILQLWRNTPTGFSNVTDSVVRDLPDVVFGSAAWADYDNDGRLDVILTGYNGTAPVAQLWRNMLLTSNAPPNAPNSLPANISGTTAVLGWNAPTDDHTVSGGLSYNVRVGSSPESADVLSPMSLTDGFRQLPATGNAHSPQKPLDQLIPGRTYYWSVQAVDTGFAGSSFAPEQQFTVPPILVAPALLPNGVFQFYFTNLSLLDFDVLSSTNVGLSPINWNNRGLATPLGNGLYQFMDFGVGDEASRYYQLQSR